MFNRDVVGVSPFSWQISGGKQDIQPLLYFATRRRVKRDYRTRREQSQVAPHPACRDSFEKQQPLDCKTRIWFKYENFIEKKTASVPPNTKIEV